MPYRVRPDGTIEADTPEEALELARLLDRKKHGKWAHKPAENAEEPAEPKKSRTRRRGEPKTRGRTRRPSAAVEHNVKVGQVYEKHKGGNSAGRIIQIEKLYQDGVMPTVVQDSPLLKRKGVAKKLSYTVLRNAYRLVKDV